MRTNKEQLDRLRIKSELGQRILSYQQTKTTEKAEEEKQKFFLKQQIMEDILRKKFQPKAPTQPPPPIVNPRHPEPKDDSKLYSFGFPNHQSNVSDYQSKQSQLQKSKQYETSGVSQDSSMPFIDVMRNKYILPPGDESRNSQVHPITYMTGQNCHGQQSEEENSDRGDDQSKEEKEREAQDRDENSSDQNETNNYQQNQSYNPPTQFIDKEIPENSYTFESNKNNRYVIENKSSVHDEADHQSNKYQIENRSNKLYEVDSKSRYQLQGNKSKYDREPIDNRSNRYEIENKSNRYDIRTKIEEPRFPSSVPNISQTMKPDQESDYDSHSQRSSTQFNFMPTEVIQNRSKQYLKTDTLSHSKFIESTLHNHKPINTGSFKKLTHEQMDYDRREDHNSYKDIDIAASNLSKQFMRKSNNSSGLLKGSHLSANNIERSEKEESGSFEKTTGFHKNGRGSDQNRQDQNQSEESDDQERTNKHKAYGGYIKEGQEDDDYLEELRKKKVMEMEKKRMNRNQERKKSQELSLRMDKSSNLEPEKREGYANNHKKEKEKDRKIDEYYNEGHNSYLPPLHPERKQLTNVKSRTSSEAEQRRSSVYDKNSDRERDKKASPNQVSSIQSSSSKGVLKTPKSSIFQLSPNRPKDKSLGKLFQDPKIQPKQRKQTFSKQSNKKMMINAITNVCLPGEINRKQRQKLLDILQSSACEYFIFLFKEYSRNVVKAVYTYESTSGEVNKVHGEKAPNQIHEEDVSKFLRFDSGAKQFKVLDGCKSFSYAVHAVYIK